MTAVLPPIYWSWGIFRSDRIVRSEQTVDSYSRALEFDPANGMLWWQRGRLSHYAAHNADIIHAISDYKMALSLNPRIGQAWVDLADCYEHTGRLKEAEGALEKACATRTYSPLIRWQVGNYYLRRGNLARMYENLRMAGEHDPEKLRMAIQLAWKADSDRQRILQKLIPDDLQSNLLYLDFLVNEEEFTLARTVWERVIQNKAPANQPFRVAASFDYIDHLLVRSRMQDALRIWTEALQKAGLRPGENSSTVPTVDGAAGPRLNLIHNGSFEFELLRGGLDWRFPEMAEVQFQLDRDNHVDGTASLRITFSGNNIAFSHLSQIVPVSEPGEYILDFALRADGLSTDQKPYFDIQGYPDAGCAASHTPMMPASAPWHRMSVQFEVKPGCRGLRLTLRRDVSAKFDNKLRGSLWLDDVRIYESGKVGNTGPRKVASPDSR